MGAKIDINEAMKLCFDNNIKIYPQIVNRSFVVVVDKNGEKKLSKKTHSTNTINKALVNTYVFVADKLKR